MKFNYILAVVSFALFGQVKAQNLVENGGFESWISDTEPEAFGPFTTGTLSVNNFLTKEAVIKKSGNFSARHTSQDGTQTIGGELVEVTGGQTYVISYWFLDNDPKATTRTWSNWMSGTTALTDPNNPEHHMAVLHQTSFSEDSPEWKKVEHILTAPSTATHLRLQARTYRGSASQVGGYIYYDDFSVVVADAASIEKNGIDGLKVYPNPVLSTDRLYISSKENRAKEIVFYDLLGKKVLETTLPQDDFINISMLSKGVYTLKIAENNKTSVRKIIIK